MGKKGFSLATVEINPGVCGFMTTVSAKKLDQRKVELHIESDCEDIQRMAQKLTEVDPFNEISHKRGAPEILAQGALHCKHAACPVPVGIVKVVEVAAGLALPRDVYMTIKADDAQ